MLLAGFRLPLAAWQVSKQESPGRGCCGDTKVNPTTYAPIEVDTYGFDNHKDVTRVRVSAYQTLPRAGHQRLLRFTTAPNARIDRTPADYYRWQLLTPF